MNEFSVTPLGTVSPYPKGNCNCPGFLVRSGDKKILLDCGNGVSRLLKFPDVFRDLIIIISHLHDAHYADLGCIANAKYRYHELGEFDDGEKTKVFFPLYEAFTYVKMSVNTYGLQYMGYNEIAWGNEDKGPLTYAALEHGDMKLSFFETYHDPLRKRIIDTSYLKTYSIKIESNGKTLVYTSDTEYDDNFIKFCRGADLLISEASFLKGQNRTPGHMYAWEAGMLAREAKVKKLMLTHFWPELPKELYVNEAKEYFENTVAAEEGKKLVLKRKV